VLVEETSLALVNQHHDVVEISNYEHDILSQNSEPLGIADQLAQSVGDSDDALELVPVLHLDQDLEQPCVEVVFKDVLLLLSAFFVFGVFLVLALRRFVVICDRKVQVLRQEEVRESFLD
jgi:hypothetical protein